MPDYTDLAQRLKLLAHPERLRILDALRREPECVCHLELVTGKPQPYISQQLRILRRAGVIEDEKNGLNVFYRVADLDSLVWLDLVLGPLPGDGAAGRHERLPACPCPKCQDAASIALLEPVQTEGGRS